MRTFEIQRRSISKDSEVLARAACFPVWLDVRTLKTDN